MATSSLSYLLSFASEVEDFRTGNRLYYPCSSIIFMTFMGILCGSEDWDDIVEICESGEDILREVLGIAIDGKYMSGVTNEPALNMVSAYATRIGLCLGQEIASKKMNEPEALRKLVRELNIKDSVITADALHCQKESVKEIIQMGGDYLPAEKNGRE